MTVDGHATDAICVADVLAVDHCLPWPIALRAAAALTERMRRTDAHKHERCPLNHHGEMPSVKLSCLAAAKAIGPVGATNRACQ